MGPPPKPLPSLTRTATTPLSQKTVDANRTEIIVLAVGILFLVSQLTIVIWLFAPRAFVRRPREQRNIAWRPVEPKPAAQENSPRNDDDDGSRRTRRRNFRRSSTWNGRSIAISHDGHPVRRRKSSGVKPADLRTFSSSDQDSDSPNSDSSAHKGFHDMGPAAASLVVPILARSPWRLPSPLGSAEAEVESEGSNGGLPEIGLLPATFSPRSPRVGPVDMAIIGAMFEANEREPGMMPMASPVVDEIDVANGFNDPLGVNRRKPLFGNDNSILMHVKASGEETFG